MQGKTYGEWIVGELINDSSGNGLVFHASKKSGENGVIKILKHFDSPDKAEKRRKRFINEIKKLEYIKQLDIPGIMPILDYNDKEIPPWFVMPLAYTLQPVGDRAEWALETSITVAQCIADLHKEGMVHRDIKPNNILVLDGKVVVSDFGLARITDDDVLTQTGEAVGSFGYTAPECVGHADEPPFESDVFTLAKTVWVLLTGAQAPPLGELNPFNDSLVNHGIKNTAIDLAQLDKLLIASTARDPNDRPTAQQFLEGLQCCRSSITSQVTQKSSSPLAHARSLFKDHAANNRRDRESRNLFQSFVDEARENFFEVWGELITEFGWTKDLISGGTSVDYVDQLNRQDWENQRYFFRGEMNGIIYDISLTLYRQKTKGEARLVYGVLIAIQYYAGEYVMASIKREDIYTSGPQTAEARQKLINFVRNPETQYRTIEKLKELSNA